MNFVKLHLAYNGIGRNENSAADRLTYQEGNE
jgi:hypothetical protein